MKYTLILHEKAFREINDAYEYYETAQTSLGDKFKSDIEKCMSQIIQNPQQYRKFKNEIRQVVLRKFPFLIVDEVVKDIIIVYSVFHTSRNPNRKLK